MENELVKLERINPVSIKEAAWNALSIESKSAYNSDYKKFFEFVNKDAKDITANDLLLYIEHLEKQEFKHNTINRKVASLSKMFKIMTMAGEIHVNPVDILKQFKNLSFKVNKGITISLTIADIRQATKVKKNARISEKRMALIIKFLAKTGLRISEFTNIKKSDILDFDNDNKIINIIGKGKKERKIYLENSFLKEIQLLFPAIEGFQYLFYNNRKVKYDRRPLWKQIHVFFRDRIDKDVHPHTLRHFFATYKINIEKQDIKAVSKFLGHSDVAITLNSYVDTALDVKSSKIKI